MEDKEEETRRFWLGVSEWEVLVRTAPKEEKSQALLHRRAAVPHSSPPVTQPSPSRAGVSLQNKSKPTPSPAQQAVLIDLRVERDER